MQDHVRYNIYHFISHLWKCATILLYLTERSAAQTSPVPTRPSKPLAKPSQVPDPDLDVGSLVQVQLKEPIYGIIRWIGKTDQSEKKTAGLELVMLLYYLATYYAECFGESDLQIIYIIITIIIIIIDRSRCYAENAICCMDNVVTTVKGFQGRSISIVNII